MIEQTIYGLPNGEYHRGEPYNGYLSSSQLKDYAKSPAYAKWHREHPDDESNNAALAFGSLFHDCLAALASGQGLDAWLSSIAVFEPPVNDKTGQAYGATTKRYTDAYAEFILANVDRPTASSEDLQLVREMAASLLNDHTETGKAVLKMLKWGKPEVSHFVEYKGCKFKCRPDLETRKKIVDWKTTSLDTFDEDSVNRVILKYGYHISAAMYQWLVHEITGEWKSFYLVLVSKQAPHDSVIVCMDDWAYRYISEAEYIALGPGAYEFAKLRGLHIQCVESGEYPSAEVFIENKDGLPIMNIQPPSYVTRKYIDEI